MLDRTVPYFPIEISRTASTGRYAQHVFKWGITSIVLSLVYEHLFLDSVWFIWLGIMTAAWFTDKDHLYIHGAGVLLIVASVFYNVWYVSEAHLLQRRICIFTCALALEAGRMALKGYVVWFVELDGGVIWSPYAYFNALWMHQDIARHVLKLMFTVDPIQEVAIVPSLTVPVLKVTGVMQWLAFYLMTTLY
ncbi:MAG: hypothetical protein K2Q45_03850 [Nitrosomonas sp.]|nr:hypothetical protein [Nitrosomonas sp.]